MPSAKTALLQSPLEGRLCLGTAFATCRVDAILARELQYLWIGATECRAFNAIKKRDRLLSRA